MVRIVLDSEDCPRDCEYFSVTWSEPTDIEECKLQNGIFEVKEEELVKCPLGKW